MNTRRLRRTSDSGVLTDKPTFDSRAQDLATNPTLQHHEFNTLERYLLPRDEVGQHVSCRLVHRSKPHCEDPFPLGAVEFQLTDDYRRVEIEAPFSWVCETD